MHNWLTIGVDTSNGRRRCRGCEKKIVKGEKAFFYLGYEFAGNDVYFYWHPECFINFAWKKINGGEITGKEVLADILELFLPLLIGSEEAQPILIALKLGS